MASDFFFLLPNESLFVSKSTKVVCFMPSTSAIERIGVCHDSKQQIFNKNIIHETTWYKQDIKSLLRKKHEDLVQTWTLGCDLTRL